MREAPIERQEMREPDRRDSNGGVLVTAIVVSSLVSHLFIGASLIAHRSVEAKVARCTPLIAVFEAHSPAAVNSST
jgi:hypothetical protein